MGSMTRALAHKATRAALTFASVTSLLAAASLAGGSDAVAAAKKAPAAQPAGQEGGAPAAPTDEAGARKQAQEVNHRAYEAGVKSFQSGKYQPAIDQLSVALRGGLASTEMARGLYYRGLAYKKLGKPGLAISDLTSALWLKNGLNEADRKSATAERADAYKAAGLGDGNTGADQVARSDPKTETAATAASAPPPSPAAAGTGLAPPAPIPAGATSSAKSDEGVPQPLSLGGESSSVAPPAQHQSARTEPAAAQADSMQAAVADTAASPAAPPAASGAAPQKSASSDFFSNLFSPSSSAEAQPDATAATSPPSTTAGTQPQTSSWQSTTPASGAAKDKDKAKAKGTAVAAVQPPAKAETAKGAAKGGKYKVHIAAVRSRAEAEALAQKVAQKYGPALASRAPTVDEAVIGSMGTFYRVRVGSYATVDEPRGLCNTLRNDGYDCLVVSN